MDGRVILSGLVGLVLLIITAMLWLAAKLKILAGIWSRVRPLISIIARSLSGRPTASTPSITINARDRGKAQNISSGGDTIIDNSRKGPTPSEVKRWLQLFGGSRVRGKTQKQRASARRSKRIGAEKSQERDDSGSSKPNPSPSSKGEEFPHTPPENDGIPSIPDSHRHILNEEGGAGAVGTATSHPPVPVERSVAYEDDSDVSRMGDADERDLYLEAVEGLTLMASPSEQVMGADWTPFASDEELDRVEADEAKSFSENSARPDQEAGVPNMDVLPAQVLRRSDLSEPTAPDVSMMRPYSEVDREFRSPDSAIIQDFPPPKLEEAEGNGALYSQKPSDPEPVPEDELEVILRSHPLATVGEVLRSRRIEVTISQPDINYDRGWVSQLEQGLFSLAPETLPKQKARLRRYLQVVGWTPEALLSHLAATE